MPGSFSAYSARLRTDRRARRQVVLSGAACATAGCIVVATLPYPLAFVAPAAAAWCAWSAGELARLWREYRCAAAVTVFPDGMVEIVRDDGRRDTGRLGPGSRLLAGRAWLRLQLPAGRSWPELFLRSGQDREQWRRFQVICRHLSAC